jgi:hypothetical protein
VIVLQLSSNYNNDLGALGLKVLEWSALTYAAVLLNGRVRHIALFLPQAAARHGWLGIAAKGDSDGILVSWSLQQSIMNQLSHPDYFPDLSKLALR